MTETFPFGITPDFFGFTHEQLSADFEIIRGAAWIERFRAQRPDGSLDIDATAKKLDVDIEHEALRPEQALLYPRTADGGWIIRYDSSLPEEQRAFMFGHEVGHIVLFSMAQRSRQGLGEFMRRSRNDQRYGQRVEAMCDFFSGKLLGYIE